MADPRFGLSWAGIYAGNCVECMYELALVFPPCSWSMCFTATVISTGSWRCRPGNGQWSQYSC